MNWPARDGWRPTRRFGFSPWDAERILQAVWAGDGSRVPGDFVAHAVHIDGEHELLVTSLVSALPYYVSRSCDSAVVHGPDLYDVADRAGHPWRWNWRAVRGMIAMDHPVGADTLHADVARVPPDSVLLIGPRGVCVRPGSFWSTSAHGSTSTPQLIRALRTVVADTVPDGAVISLSAGFDSRLLLAATLAAERQCRLLTVGHDGSTDRVVAEAIAAREKLPLRTVTLAPEDYLDAGPVVARLTGGSKPASSWHTYLYTRAGVGDPSQPHIVGSNGEYVRTFFLDRGSGSLVADRLGVAGLAAYFQLKAARRARGLPWFGGSRARIADGRRMARLSGPGPSLLHSLDVFYATQRVRHFIGNGLALYADQSSPRAPMLDARWVRPASVLPRRERLGARWHRQAIAALWPRLLEYPADGRPRMTLEAPSRYWRGDRNAVGYSPFSEVARSDAAQAVVRESPVLAEFLSPAAINRAIQSRPDSAVDLLLTLHFAGAAAS